MIGFPGETRCWRRNTGIAVLFMILFTLACQAQSALGDLSGEGGNQALENRPNSEGIDSGPDPSRAGMPAEDLIEVLRNNPEVMVEVKTVVADAAQQQGLAVQPDALSDQQVFAQIEASPALRANLTQFLRARGYISDAEIEAAQRKVQTPGLQATDREGQANPSPELLGRAGITGSVVGERSGAAGLLPSDARGQTGEMSAQMSEGQRRTQSQAPNLTEDPQALHRPAPYNMRSLRDLYTQVPDAAEHLKRFGSDLFTVRNVQGERARTANTAGADTALDVPLGPEYVLGPGDELSVSLWGGVSQNLLRIIDREGRISLPEAGPMQVAGLTMEKAQALIGDAMQAQFRNAHVAVTVAQVRSIRIFVVGDVQRPGAYEISALASPVSALFAAGGPTAVGSLRILRHFRNQAQIGEIDLYDFMLHGIRPSDDRLESGDTLLVPPVGPQVAVGGAVKRPAIYELKDEKDLASVLDDAGGLTVAASLTHITIDRIAANQQREEVAVSVDEHASIEDMKSRLGSTEVKDGDRVRCTPILPYSERVIYLQGHVARPGKIAYRDGMRISDVLRSYQDLLPEPAEHGEIVRLVGPDLHPETIAFSVPEILIGNANIALQAFDTIRIFGRYELDAPMVSIRGEVQRPGTYPMSEGMSAAQLVRMAGGFRRDALVETADLASYQVENGTRVNVRRQDVAIGEAVLKGDHDADVALKPGDILTVHQLTGWNDIGASIILEGEVAHPGSYGFQEGEHLSDVLRRAGGFRSTAYPAGAVLTRPEVAVLEEKSKQELIRQIETGAAAARLSPGAASGEQGAALQLIQKQQDDVLGRLRSQPATGRLVIHLDAAMESWAGTSADIEVRSGDVLRIPKRPGFVLVSGQVYNPTAITFTPGRTAGWYLQRAGGATSIANRKEIFIIRANGTVIGRRSERWYDHDVLASRLDPGDTIVVPQKIIGPSLTWRNLLGTAQVAASLAIAAAVSGL